MAITVKVFGDSDSSGKLFSALSVLLFVFGIGVGGEYPLSAASASEKATSSFLQHQRQAKQDHQRAKPSESSKTDDKSIPLITATSTTPVPSMNEVTTAAGLDDELPQPGQQQIIGGELHENSTPTTQSQPSRGRQVQLVFTMQGMGIWVNCITVMLLLWVTGQTGRAGGGDGAVNGNGQNQYDHQKLLLVTQVTYLIGALVLLVVLATRYLFLEESQVWIQDQHRLDSIHKNANTALSLEVPDRRSNDASNENAADGNAGQIYASDAFIIESPETDQKNRSNPKNPHMSTAEVTTSRPPDASEDFNPSHLDLLLRNYGVRLFGASASWLLWDISFYGNKLFQASFLLALTGEQTTLLELSAAATLNATVALLGYFGAALLIDHPGVGRLKLQSGGLFVTGGLFVMCGFSFERMSSSLLVPIYLASSFFGQLGPNATTFTIPTEIFPTEQRTLCHGICASSGKLGALIAAVLFHRLNNDADLFLISGYASFAACLVSLWTIPETNGLNLLELDIKWRMTLEGRKREYDGPANHPDFLSMYERWMKGVAIKNPSHA
jgi:MFS family permease